MKSRIQRNHRNFILTQPGNISTTTSLQNDAVTKKLLKNNIC